MSKVCPVCRDLSNKDGNYYVSKLYFSVPFTTHVRVDEYHDESGRFHSHDGNKKTGTWSCSNGHKGRYSGIDPCPRSGENCPYTGSFEMWEDEPEPVLEEPKKEPIMEYESSIIGSTSYSLPSHNASISHSYYVPEENLPSGSTNFSKLAYFSDGDQTTIIVDLLNKQMEMGKEIEELSKKIGEMGKVLENIQKKF